MLWSDALRGRNIRVRPTASGLCFLGLSLFLFLSAANTGNNLLILISTNLCLILVFSFVWSALQARTLVVEWAETPDGNVGSDLVLTVGVRNTGSIPAFLLRLESEWLESLESGKEFFFRVRRTPGHRGMVTVADVNLESLFPLGLFRASHELPTVQVCAFPRPCPYRDPMGSAGGSRSRDLRAEADGDYWMHRQYQPGEDARHIDWVATARGEQEWVTLRAAPRTEPRKFWVDPRAADPAMTEAFLERVVELLLNISRQKIPALFWNPVPGHRGWMHLENPQALRDSLRWVACWSPEETFTVPPECPERSCCCLSPTTLLPLGSRK